MKNFKTVIALVTLSLATLSMSAKNINTEPDSKTEKTILRNTIVDLLGKHSYSLHKTLEAQVSIILNNKNELVVVGVNSKNENVASFVKSKLNYKKINVKGIKKGTVYRVPLKMEQSI